MDLSHLIAASLLAFIVPLWLLAGFGDWLCHRRQDIAHTSGWRESLLHLLLIGEGGLAVLAGLLLEINATTLALMLACYAAHELTVWVDLRYAAPRRAIPPVEQMLHSLQEVLPLAALLLVALLHWDQFLALFGLAAGADWRLALKDPPLHPIVVAAVLAGCLLLAVAPFTEELLRCLRASGRRGEKQQVRTPP
jgi:hypothetical protein